jgi:hypothetical protein
MNAIEKAAPQLPTAQTVDDVIARGDLSNLSAEQRVVHYHNVCRSLGLNPVTQPFAYITLSGKLTLYAKRDACDQLRKLHGINIHIPDRTVHDGLLTVHAKATDKTGRTDEDLGVVSIAGLRGEAASNAVMKAVTKAKRRVTLSICGLGFLDETEVEDIPDAVREDITLAPPKTTTPENKVPSSDDYVERWMIFLEDAESSDEVAMKWNAEKALRNNIDWADRITHSRLLESVTRRIQELKQNKQPDLKTQRYAAEES